MVFLLFARFLMKFAKQGKNECQLYTTQTMLGFLRRQAVFQVPRNARRLSGVVATNSFASGFTSPLPTPSSSPSKTVTQSYFVPRNTQGNLPVYTDVRNAGGRYLVLIRNVEGNVAVCFSAFRYSYTFS